MSDTPRTDALDNEIVRNVEIPAYHAMLCLARELEREADALRATLRGIANCTDAPLGSEAGLEWAINEARHVLDNTPRTDAEVKDPMDVMSRYVGADERNPGAPRPSVVPAEFARELERELAEYKKHHPHVWNDGCKVSFGGEWRMQFCACGKSRKKPDSHKDLKFGAPYHCPVCNKRHAAGQCSHL